MTVGNIISFVIALIAIITLCWQFFSFRRQKIDDKFYELLRLHRQNVEEMKVGILTGRQVFKEMFYELFNCQLAVNNVFDELKQNAANESMSNPDNDEITGFYTDFDYKRRKNLAYQLFFRGIEFNHLYKVISSNGCILESEKITIQEKLKEYFLKQYDNWQQGDSSMTENKKSENNKIISYYKPYCGQSEWLGHYFRHLYRTVRFIDTIKFIHIAWRTKNVKCEYIKTLKAQLSEYEQAILYYHACSDLGKEWLENNFVEKYKLTQFLPLIMVKDEFDK